MSRIDSQRTVIKHTCAFPPKKKISKLRGPFFQNTVLIKGFQRKRYKRSNTLKFGYANMTNFNVLPRENGSALLRTK